MQLRTAQWNIGGGKIRDAGSDPTADKSYWHSEGDGIAHIVETLRWFEPHIITLQETHANGENVQAKTIADALGLKYFVNDEYADSHVESGQRLGQAILSAFPITEHSFTLFENPKYRVERPDGEVWISHDKGIAKCTVDIGQPLVVETLHMFPFRRFGVDTKEETTVMQDITDKIHSDAPLFLLQGDFNMDDKRLAEFLPDLFTDELEEIPLDQPTTPKGRYYDHIAYRGLKLKDARIIDTVLTDHYPVCATFEYQQEH